MQDKTMASRIFDISNYTFLLLFATATIMPFFYIISSSISSTAGFIPRDLTFEWYGFVFSNSAFLRSLSVSVLVTVAGTLVNLVLTCLMAFPLAKKELVFRKTIMMGVIFTMLFNGGMIPLYFVVRGAGMLDSIWSLILPTAISAFNLIIVKNFFQNLPEELEESAMIDGCKDLGILWRIIIPLSKPVLATFGLFYAVTHWNRYFDAILYINNSAKWPIQVMLRQIIILSEGGDGSDPELASLILHAQNIKMAVIIVATIPILLIYPFLQKHFAKGVLLGSVKG
ncbi:carbohydrate ABC transporter permease [Paenibacillus luteus]|uniref:carbohydrate ABC transporter permease n=1 Tax=Paenibacillus luteus TaxID=2545753 RepID=UPI00114517E8|nr:carbohydrate ABC transporter permease [Paenibacillus luteus]